MTAYRYKFLALCVSFSAFLASVSDAAIITVTSTDAGLTPGSLRQAIADAADGDEIQFSVGDATAIAGTNENRGSIIDKSITITGPSSATLTVGGRWIIPEAKRVVISNLSFSNTAPAPTNRQAFSGGAISNAGTLEIYDCNFRNCSVGDECNGGALANSGVLRLTRCTFTDNYCRYLYLYSGGGSGGAIYQSGGVMVIQDCTFLRNAGAGLYSIATQGSRSGHGGAIASYGTLSISGSTFSGNNAGSNTSGGGDGGAIFANSDATIVNSVITNNRAGDKGFNPGGSGGFGGGVYGTNVYLANCTISGNVAPAGAQYPASRSFPSGNGGGIAGSGTIRNCSITGNIAEDGYDSRWGQPPIVYGEPDVFGAWTYETVQSVGFESTGIRLAEAVAQSSVTVTRTGDTTGTATVQFATTAGSASPGSDFTGASGTLSFAPGETQKTISIPIIDDSLFEADETFSITLSAPSPGTALGPNSTHTITIQSDDVQSLVSFASDSLVLGERAGTANLVISRTANTSGTATVSFSTTDGTAIAGLDYTASSGTVTFASGETQQIIPLTILDNSQIDGTRTFSVSLSSADAGTAVGTKSTATVSIESDDWLASFDVDSSSISESSGNALVTISRTGNTSAVGSLQFETSSGTATANLDYSPRSGVISFLAGERSTTISIPILDDTLFEGAETFSIRISSPDGVSGHLGGPASHTITVISEDRPSIIEFALPASSEMEGDGTAQISVIRGGNSSTTASVVFSTADGSAIAGTHYTANSGTIMFEPGETQKVIQVAILDNFRPDTAKSFLVRLSSSDGQTQLGSQTTHVVNIVNDDAVSVVQFAQGGSVVEEFGKRVDVKVVRLANLNVPSTVDFATADGTARAGVDFTPLEGALSFAIGETQKVISVELLADSESGAAKTFSLSLSKASADTQIGGQSIHTVTVSDSPYANRPANYRGIVRNSSGVGIGGFQVKVTKRGEASGRLEANGRTLRFTGRFDPHGYLNIAYRTGETLGFRISPDGSVIVGRYSSITGTHALEGEADSDSDDRVGGISNWTAVLESNLPPGWMTMRIKARNQITLAGKLPDGESFTIGTATGIRGNIFAFTKMYSAKGWLAGLMRADHPGTLPLLGTLHWTKPPARKGRYSDGLQNQELNIRGALYQRPFSNVLLDDFQSLRTTTGSVTFINSSGLVERSVTFLIYTSNRVLFGFPASVSLRFNERNGTFSGSIQNGGRYEGICIQQLGPVPDIATGFYDEGSCSGQVVIKAQQ